MMSALRTVHLEVMEIKVTCDERDEEEHEKDGGDDEDD